MMPKEYSDDPLHTLRQIMRRLRAECPWDQAQTPLSLTRYAIEEAYEVDAAVRSGVPDAVCDELGDLLLQVLFQSCLYEEQGAFTLEDVMAGLQAKLIRRHPHVFGEASAADAQAVQQQWQRIKAQEKALQHRSKTPNQDVAASTIRLLDQVKPGPVLMQAQSLQKIAATVGFDWPDVAGARLKLDEELAELDQAVEQGERDAIEDELGDVLFAVINVARKLGQNSELALLRTQHKFRQRFAHMEDQLARQGLRADQVDLQTLETLWQQAKHQPST